MRTYETGKIYMLTNKAGDKYIGSTIKTLSERMSGHKYDYKRYKKNKFHYLSSFKVMNDNTYRMILLEEYPCNNRMELESREGYYQRETEGCVNIHINKRQSIF